MSKIPITKIIRSKRKNITLLVTHDATLIVRAPTQTSLSYIEKLVAQKADWIERKMREFKQCPKVTKKTFSAGEEFIFLGKKYKLVPTDGFKIEITKNLELLFPRVFLWRAKVRLLDWYKKQAKQELISRTEALALKTGLSYHSVDISQAKGCWGSCSPRNVIHLNWRLIMAPKEVLEYVIMHELTHTLEKNHSTRFWNRLAGFFPEYAKQRHWLRKNGHLLEL